MKPFVLMTCLTVLSFSIPSLTASLPISAPLPAAGPNDWLTEEIGHMYDTTRCNIDRLPWSTPYELFREKYFLQKPVIFYPDTDVQRADFNATRQVWSRENVLRLYGGVTVDLGNSHSLTAYGEKSIEMTLAQYVEELRNPVGIGSTHYLFDRLKFLSNATVLHDSYLDIHHPHFDYRHHPDLYDTVMTFALGPSSSGISHHWHKDGWNQVLFGRKRWFLYPIEAGTPPYGYNQHEPVSVWYQKHYHLLKDDELPIECMQYEGEMFYVPETWFHATINVGETIAVAGQTKHASLSTQQFLISQALDKEQQMEKQIPLFKAASKMSLHRHSQILGYIGNVYRGNNYTAQAIEYYERALQWNPQHTITHQALAQVLMEKQDYDRAFNHLIVANELNPNNYESMLHLATTLYESKQYQQAKEWLQRAIQLPLRNPTGEESSARMNAYVNFAVTLYQLDQFQDCVTLAQQRLRIFPAEDALRLIAAECERELNHYEIAQQLLTGMLMETPKPIKLAARLLQLIEKDIHTK